MVLPGCLTMGWLATSGYHTVPTVTSCLTVHGVTCGYFMLPLLPSALDVHGVPVVTSGYHCYLLPDCAMGWFPLLIPVPVCLTVHCVVTSHILSVICFCLTMVLPHLTKCYIHLDHT